MNNLNINTTGLAYFAAVIAFRQLVLNCPCGSPKKSINILSKEKLLANVAGGIDHTVLKPTSVDADIQKLCKEAIAHKFAAVCVPPNFVALAKSLLSGFNIQVATVVGFPFGYSCIDAKVAETEKAITDGADEIDVVANISAIKRQDWKFLSAEVAAILEPVRRRGKVLKVIIESGVLTDEEIIECCKIYGDARIDFLKTSTGYAESGASVHAVSLFRKHLPSSVEIKASGGIRDLNAALSMINAGATRIGCSAGVAIANAQKGDSSYSFGSSASSLNAY